jgi:isoquinoline 1-oxidoreductase subunit alpha
MPIPIKVNCNQFDVDADPATPLLWVLRDHLGLTGTKYGCGWPLDRRPIF